MSDPFYKSDAWKRLRAAVIKRSKGMCEVKGCTAPGKVVDHVISRKRGGADAMDNLRHLCRWHDNQVKERPDGTRPNGGKFKPNAACGADGLPLDTSHPFFDSTTHTGASNLLAGRGAFEHQRFMGSEARGPRVSTKFRGPR